MRPTLSLLAKSGSSKQWLSRQARDPYVKERASSPSHYRSRSAFKLLQLDKKFNIIKHDKTKVVIDLGAAPGGWSQVVAEILGVSEPKGAKSGKTNAEAIEDILAERDSGVWSAAMDQSATRVGGTKTDKTIIALDLLLMAPLRGVRTVRQDFLAGDGEIVRHLLPTPETKADVILSDIAPNATGNKTRDIASGLEVCEAVFRFATRYLRAERIEVGGGGTLVLKHFANESTKAFYVNTLKPNFRHTYIVKPDASRDESSEYFFVSKGFLGDSNRTRHGPDSEKAE